MVSCVIAVRIFTESLMGWIMMFGTLKMTHSWIFRTILLMLIIKKKKIRSLCRQFWICKSKKRSLYLVSSADIQKGLDIIMEALDGIVEAGGQVVFTGTGDKKYHRMIEEATQRYPRQVGKFLKFDERIAHKIYAASDFFLMPSLYEPCGLGQMIALRYGSIPIVHKTGGLADTIHLYDPIHKVGNGFVFTEYTKENFIEAVEEALKVYKQKDQMEGLIEQAMRYRFSWEKSAKEYVKVYQKCLS